MHSYECMTSSSVLNPASSGLCFFSWFSKVCKRNFVEVDNYHEMYSIGLGIIVSCKAIHRLCGYKVPPSCRLVGPSSQISQWFMDRYIHIFPYSQHIFIPQKLIVSVAIPPERCQVSFADPYRMFLFMCNLSKISAGLTSFNNSYLYNLMTSMCRYSGN